MIECRRENTIPDCVWDLYQATFPEPEKIPKESFQRVMDGKAVLYTYHDDGFVGFTLQYNMDDRVYFVYIANEPEKRCKGYGSEILKLFREINAGKRIFVILELRDEKADNCEQRLRRIGFYERNGCSDTGVRVWSDGYEYGTMSVQGSLTAEEIDEMVREFDLVYKGLM